MVSRARGDFGFGSKRTFHQERAIRASREREGGRMDQDGFDFDFLAYGLGDLQQRIMALVGTRNSERFSNFPAFLLIQPEDYVEVFLKLSDKLQRAQDIVFRALLGIGHVEEQEAPFASHTRTNLFENLGPNVAHESEHCPVDESD